MQIRLFRPQDTDQIAQLFHQTVHEINRRDYSSNQCLAWSPEDIYFRDWANICSSRYTFVAEIETVIVGFGELEANGHIDCFYCHKDYQRCGVGSQIYRAIEEKAMELGLQRLFTAASITAKPFFQHLGFATITEQQVTCRGETFTNYAMEKFLHLLNVG
jgi:putative acetyltransferase